MKKKKLKKDSGNFQTLSDVIVEQFSAHWKAAGQKVHFCSHPLGTWAVGPVGHLRCSYRRIWDIEISFNSFVLKRVEKARTKKNGSFSGKTNKLTMFPKTLCRL